MVQITATLLLAALATANPIFNWKRQDVTSAVESAVESVISSATDGAASATSLASSVASDVPSSASSAGSASAVESASASSGSASASASAVPMYPGFPCPEGLLTYSEAQQAYPGVSLEQAVGFLSNWAQGVPYPIVNSTGTNETGAERTYTVQGLNISEVLVNQTIDASGFLHSDWNLSQVISTNGLTIYSAATHLDYYTNSTTQESTANIYSNFCASDQETGRAAYTQLLQGTLVAVGEALTGGSASSAASSGASSAASSGASSAAAPVASASSSAASGVSSAAEGASSVASSVAGGAVESLTSEAGALTSEAAQITSAV